MACLGTNAALTLLTLIYLKHKINYFCKHTSCTENLPAGRQGTQSDTEENASTSSASDVARAQHDKLESDVSQAQHDKNGIQLNTHDISNGLYFVKLETNSGSRVAKLVVSL